MFMQMMVQFSISYQLPIETVLFKKFGERHVGCFRNDFIFVH